MQKKSFETIVYSTAGILVMLAIVIGVNLITGAFPFRADLTQDKAYTLSAGTKAILKKLDAPVTIRFYCTQGATATPEAIFLKDYARNIADLLQEYKQVAGNKLIIQKLDPEPDSDAEDSAQLDGLEPQQLSDNDNFYLGLSVGQADQRATIPFFEPNREKLLEYDITRAIAQVIEPQKATIGVMSSLPVFGEPANPMMGQDAQGSQPWTIIQQLQQEFNVERIAPDADAIDSDVDTLVVIYPKGISDQTQFAIDQFVLRGGKLIAFLDPESVYLSQQQQGQMPGETGGGASLDKLLKAWGIGFDPGKVVADLDFKMELPTQNGQVEAPAWLALTSDGINQNDAVSSEIDNIWLPLCGAFIGQPADGLKETVLLHSSKNAELVDSYLAEMGGSAMMSSFKPAGTIYDLAIRLTGKFKTAFPDGPPADPNETNAVKKTDNSLKQSSVESSVVLVGDSDLLADDFSLQKTDSPFGELVNPLNANLDFAQNLVEQMAGDSDLIGLRSRAAVSRPFTRVKEMEASAEATGEAKIAGLQQSLNDTQQQLEELQQHKSKDQRYILSPEQQADIENFRKKQAEVSRELREAQKDLRKEIVSMETRLTWINILAMPALVTFTGMTMAVVKRKKTSAK